jgi:hypothetical protein
MNVAEYLRRPVMSLAERCPDNPHKRGRQKGGVKTNEQRRAEALEKYKTACAGQWTTTACLIGKLGMKHGSCRATLLKWHEQGIIERRQAGDSANWRRCDGFEWRFK